MKPNFQVENRLSLKQTGLTQKWTRKALLRMWQRSTDSCNYRRLYDINRTYSLGVRVLCVKPAVSQQSLPISVELLVLALDKPTQERLKKPTINKLGLKGGVGLTRGGQER